MKEQDGREKQVGATPHFKSAKHRVRCANFFRYSVRFSIPPLFHLPTLPSFLIAIFSRECGKLVIFIAHYPHFPLLFRSCFRSILATIETHFLLHILVRSAIRYAIFILTLYSRSKNYLGQMRCFVRQPDYFREFSV